MANIQRLRRLGHDAPILTIAHRGARAYAPENTLAAFSKAHWFGCDMVELDVRLSKDGVVMVHHDGQLDRCTDVVDKFPGRETDDLGDFTYAELASLDAGSWYMRELALKPEQRQEYLQSLTDAEISEFILAEERDFYLSGQVKLPTLLEVLALAKQTGLRVNIELKGHAQAVAMTDKVVTLVENMVMAEKVLVSSFEHDLLAQVRQLSTAIATGFLTDKPLADPVTYLQTLDADAYNLGCCSHHDDPALIQQQITALRALELGVNAWTCNRAEQIQWLVKAGVTGIISDFPNRVREHLDFYVDG